MYVLTPLIIFSQKYHVDHALIVKLIKLVFVRLVFHILKSGLSTVPR